MFREEIPGGVENGLYYLERFFALIARIFSMFFGGSSDTTTAPETTTAVAETTTLAE